MKTKELLEARERLLSDGKNDINNHNNNKNNNNYDNSNSDNDDDDNNNNRRYHFINYSLDTL